MALGLLVSEWVTVTYLGEPDHGVIAASFMGAFLMAGAFLAFAALVSSLTKNQVLAFVVPLVLLLVNLTVGVPGASDWPGAVPVSYTPLTLPTIPRALDSLVVVPVSKNANESTTTCTF